MSWLSDALTALAGLPRPLVLAGAGLFAFGETGIGFGLVVPGESGVLLLATTTSGLGGFLVMAAVVFLGAVAGDSLGFLLGNRYGGRLRETRVIRRAGQENWDRAAALLRRRGPWAVLVARFLPVVRSLTPAAAGTAGMRYRSFLPASAAGAAVWACLHVGIGVFAAESIHRFERITGQAGWIVAGVLAVVTAVIILRRRRRRHQVTVPIDSEGNETT